MSDIKPAKDEDISTQIRIVKIKGAKRDIAADVRETQGVGNVTFATQLRDDARSLSST